MHLAHQPDTRPHSSIQTWSRGAVFPAVIKRVETYPNPLGYPPDVHPNVLLPESRWHVLLNGTETEHSSYDAAEQHARHQVALDRCRENGKAA